MRFVRWLSYSDCSATRHFFTILCHGSVWPQNLKWMWHYWLLDNINGVNLSDEILQNCGKVPIHTNDSNISKLVSKKLRTDKILESFLQQLTPQSRILAKHPRWKICSDWATKKIIFFSYPVWNFLSFRIQLTRMERFYYTTQYSRQNSFKLIKLI